MSYGPHTSNAGETLARLQAQFAPNLSLPVRRHDVSAWAGTIGSWDFTTVYGAPGGPDTVVTGVVPAGTPMRNLVPGGADALQTDTYADTIYTAPGGGAVGGLSIGSSVRLAPLASFVGLALVGWFQASGAATTGGNSRVMKLGPVYLIPDGSRQVEIVGPNMDNGFVSADLLDALSAPQPHPRQIGLYLRDRGSGNYRAELFLDRNPVFVGADHAAGQAAASEAAIGARDGAGTVPGLWQAARVDDFTVPGGVFEAMLSADYRLRGRAFGRYDY